MIFQNKLIIFTKEKIWNINELFHGCKIHEIDLKNQSITSGIEELDLIHDIYLTLSDMCVRNNPFHFVTIVIEYKRTNIDMLFLSLEFWNILEINSKEKFESLEDIYSEINNLHRAYEDIWNAIYIFDDSLKLELNQEGLYASYDTKESLENADYSLKMVANDVHKIFVENFQIFSKELPEVY